MRLAGYRFWYVRQFEYSDLIPTDCWTSAAWKTFVETLFAIIGVSPMAKLYASILLQYLLIGIWRELWRVLFTCWNLLFQGVTYYVRPQQQSMEISRQQVTGIRLSYSEFWNLIGTCVCLSMRSSRHVQCGVNTLEFCDMSHCSVTVRTMTSGMFCRGLLYYVSLLFLFHIILYPISCSLYEYVT